MHGVTNRPITKLYLMEITETVAAESTPQVEQDSPTVNSDEKDEATGRSIITTRKAATRARHQLSEWSQILGAPSPPRMSRI